MTISSSLNAGVAGLAANSSRLASISDNIANSATNGYRRSVTNFHALVNASGGDAYVAGGVTTSTQRLVDRGGTLTATNNPTDLAVKGRGFIPVTEAAQVTGGGDYGMNLATTGSFSIDADGYLRTPTNLILLGVPADVNGEIPQFPRDAATGLVPVRIDENSLVVERTSELQLGVNLPATETQAGATGDPFVVTTEYFDDLGLAETLDIEFTPQVPGAGLSHTWDITIVDNANGATIGDFEVAFDPNTGAVATVTPATGTYAGGVATVATAAGNVDISLLGELTQIADVYAPTGIRKDGSGVGSIVSVEVDENGLLAANYDNGLTKVLYQIPIVDVPNPNGMKALDNQTYQVSRESGPFYLWDAGDGPTRSIAGYALEESATDVAGELTQLIQTQRAYSSNAKVIQTVDEMLQETTNIKR